jgi:hypothetical protein
MEPHREALVCDNSMYFLSKDTRIMTSIIQIVVASVLPTSERDSQIFINSLITSC